MEQFLKSIPHKFSKHDEALLGKALAFARKAHGEQKRKSGEPFVLHPISAAIILGQIFPDTETIVATLLHDIPEDTEVKLEEIEKEFGKDIAHLVDGVTKLGHVRLLNSKDEYYVENLRKMFIATSKDVRVMMIKLADRLHNMRTIEFLPPEKQLKVATETLEMYAPIAGRLGIGTWKDELEDLSFRIISPEDYQKTKTMLESELEGWDVNVKAVIKELTTLLQQEGIKVVNVTGREKRIYSLFKKIKKYQGDISKIYDKLAFRVITKSTPDCYAALGVIHKHFQPVPGRLKDFIATPKPNGYQSLHTTVFDNKGRIFEIQFRTDLMDEEAERGIAAHWFYSEQGKKDNLQRQTSWFKELHAWEKELTNADEFLESLKIDFFQNRIFVLTPKGDVKDLPTGASIIDFAFSVHSDLGYHMMGAKVNGKMASIYDPLFPGAVVEIIKSKNPVKISRDWLDAAKSSHARSLIRKYLKENDKGIMMRVKELKDIGIQKFWRKR